MPEDGRYNPTDWLIAETTWLSSSSVDHPKGVQKLLQIISGEGCHGHLVDLAQIKGSFIGGNFYMPHYNV